MYYTEATQFDVVIGRQYRVFGMMLFGEEGLGESLRPAPDWYPPQTGLAVLVCPDCDDNEVVRPDWYPIELFSIEDHAVPDDWEFSSTWQYPMFQNPQPAVQARWGYRQLVHSDEHFDGLINRESEALRVFRDEYEKRIPRTPR